MKSSKFVCGRLTELHDVSMNPQSNRTSYEVMAKRLAWTNSTTALSLLTHMRTVVNHSSQKNAWILHNFLSSARPQSTKRLGKYSALQRTNWLILTCRCAAIDTFDLRLLQRTNVLRNLLEISVVAHIFKKSWISSSPITSTASLDVIHFRW